jgi:selenocysteine lyase/cysteine desulfurase
LLNHKLIEAEYPFLGDIIYVDGCQMGLPPQRTQTLSQNFMEEYTRRILEDGDAGFGDSRKKVRALLAELIGGRPEEIVLTKNTTEGTAILATGYPLGPGDNVVTCDLEHASNLHPWLNASRKRGFELRIVKTKNGCAMAEDIISRMDRNTKVVTISVVQAGTGYYADLEKLSKACHERGAILVVDAIQAVGRLAIDVRKQGIDYLSCGGYKGLMAGFGVGFAWCAEELICRIDPVYAGAFSTNTFAVPPEVVADESAIVLRSDSARLESGTYNSFGISMMASSVSLLVELGIHEIDRHIRQLERQLRDLLKRSDFVLVTPEDPARQGGMVVAYYPKEHFEQVEAALASKNICLTHRPGYLRLVLSFHNTQAQVETIAAALCGVAMKTQAADLPEGIKYVD